MGDTRRHRSGRPLAGIPVSFIEIEDVTFSYSAQPEVPALRELSCGIKRGSFVGITGASEAGKSSFCRLISGYIPHFFDGDFSGRVTVGGVDTSEATIGDLAEKVGFVFENPFDQLTGASLTVLEEAAFALENMGLPREEIRRRAEESLAQVGIGDLADRHPRQLSGGQSQRLALASVLASQPEVFILDEPTSQLDPLGVEEVFDVVSGMHRRGYTVVLVSQDLERLAAYADRLVFIEDGRIKWDGEPRDVLIEAAENRHPILIPDTLEIGRRLRKAGRLDPDSPIPLGVKQAAADLAPLGRRVANTEPTPPPPSHRIGAVTDEDARLTFEDVHSHLSQWGAGASGSVSEPGSRPRVCVIGQNGAPERRRLLGTSTGC